VIFVKQNLQQAYEFLLPIYDEDRSVEFNIQFLTDVLESGDYHCGRFNHGIVMEVIRNA
jgi:hypothetical protein